MLTSTTTTTTATSPTNKLRLRHVRHVSNSRPKLSPRQLCKSLPAPVDTLDLSRVSPTRTLASLHFLVLSHLSDLERRLSELESPDLETWKARGEIKIEEARQWAKTALEMLDSIRADVHSHLPDIHFSDLASVESFLRARIPELPDLPTLANVRSHFPEMPDVRSHLPELPHLPDMAEMRSHLFEMPYLLDMHDVRAHLPDLADVRSKLDDARTRFQEIDFNTPLNYVPTLSAHLQKLHSHLSSAECEFTKILGPFSLDPSSLLIEVLDALVSSEITTEFVNGESDSEETENFIEKATHDVTSAIERSLEGVSLITYHDLPHAWRNNPFIMHGYRFIPIERWPLLIKSIFMLHNETLNIYTHMIPLILYILNLTSIIRNQTYFDAPEVFFTAFASICLLASTIWHIMSGCAHHPSMELCARVDYVGIGWLISASVGTVVHYGFQCHPTIGHGFLVLCFSMGLLGNILPFMSWFNEFEYRFHRMGFFLALAFSSIAPLFGMATLHSHKETIDFITPLFPSFASYLIGLAFYAYHWPERHLPESICRYLDRIGCSSHAIWHCLIVLAVSQHKKGMQSMKEGLQCLAEYASDL